MAEREAQHELVAGGSIQKLVELGAIQGLARFTFSHTVGFGNVLLVEATGQSGGQQKSYVFKSIDGGATWRYVVAGPSDLALITFVTESRWLQFVFPERETTDAGATWHDYTSDYRQAAPIAPDLVFADPSVGHATVRGTIKRTVDGCAHWVSITTPGT